MRTNKEKGMFQSGAESPPGKEICEMGRIVSWLDRTAYPGIASNWDDAMLRGWVLAALNPNARILDLGAGAGIVWT